MRSIGVCTSSRSERHLVEALINEMNNGKYDLKAELINFRDSVGRLVESYRLYDFDFLILPADRSEMVRVAIDCFHKNIPFCHFLAGSQSYSFTHDDTNRWMISLMANICFAESPRAVENLVQMGIPIDRIILTGTSHFDGITIQDIEANRPKNAPTRLYDVVLYNALTQEHGFESNSACNEQLVHITPNEDSVVSGGPYHSYSHLEFLWLLHHAEHFNSNSSAGIYELPYLQKYYGSKCKWINPSQRNRERTPIDPMYCKGASKIIAEWAETVDLEWLKTPKRLFQDTNKSFPSGY